MQGTVGLRTQSGYTSPVYILRTKFVCLAASLNIAKPRNRLTSLFQSSVSAGEMGFGDVEEEVKNRNVVSNNVVMPQY